ncbi:sigma 54-interacting transcriptional regulator [Pasteurellaceae bacterium HPA106]|uniref:sigma 54-interacting transcriptional regulator n=1 Tax=Spirabiliibacterium pneumoniae TaxID=221400 RepID=UPI001AADC76F|nr:sigma 54-interacting transcriptional regulator [Spirabiliibacterium pneumoniae]MBE2895619.1 sigma 54-interacting transcriptional regulator [Spirabiliibacterium pneumoniae]
MLESSQAITTVAVVNTNNDEIIAQSAVMQGLLSTLATYAQSNAPLLIQGETGTGKDLFAKRCHQLSPRRAHKFIAINCAGLPPEDAEQEMFGHASGEYTSIGFFEYANHGTVLLDSVNELSLALQAKLLRFVNDGTYRRVGEEKEHKADVRVICTSQKPLSYYVEKGELREDLYHRLNVLSLEIPPLRTHVEDIEPLVKHFLPQISQQLGKNVPAYDRTFIQQLEAFEWAGNVRELYNALYRSCVNAEPNTLLTLAEIHSKHNNHKTVDIDDFANMTLEEIIGQYEEQVLQAFYLAYPSTRKLATRLGTSHTTIANKLKLYGIKK